LGEENGNCTGDRRQPGNWKATALQLAREGYTVAVNYQHNIKAATDVINQIVEAGGKAFAVRRISAMKRRCWRCLTASIVKASR
jgi:hypothetical protein